MSHEDLTEDDTAYGYSTPEQRLKIDALALPVAFAIAALCKLLVFPGLLCWYFFSIPAHELGHTIFAWLGGRWAVPIGALIPMAGFTWILPESSWIAAFLMIAAIGGAAYWGVREKRPALLVLALIALLAHYRLFWKDSIDQWEVAVSWGGIAGEHWLGTLLLLGFYHELPRRIRWDFFRFLALIPGAWIFLNSYWTWYQIGRKREALPWGSFMDGSSDSGGDLQRLVEAGWKTTEIISSYRSLGNACLVLLAGYYVYFLYHNYLAVREST